MDAPELTAATKVYCDNLACYLRSKGYVVIPRERHVLVQARYVVPPHDLEHSRISVERYADMVRGTQLRRLIAEADDAGLILHERRDLNDPVTGREVVFTSAMALIKPKADGE